MPHQSSKRAEGLQIHANAQLYRVVALWQLRACLSMRCSAVACRRAAVPLFLGLVVEARVDPAGELLLPSPFAFV